MIRAGELQETEAILHLAQIYDKGVDGPLSVMFDSMHSLDLSF